MSTKAIKRELLAAVAMLLVALIALSGSTYAWFASNNQVDATLSSIKATSDGAFLEISDTSNTWNNKTSVAINTSTQALLPTHVQSVSGGAVTWETAHSDDPNNYTNTSGYDTITSNVDEYVWKTTVYIRAQSGEFTNLNISDVNIEATTSGSGTELISAGRILAVCGSNYQLFNTTQQDSELQGQGTLYTGIISTSSNVKVDLYFFYDGNDSNVFTNNLDDLKAINAVVMFTALQQ